MNLYERWLKNAASKPTALAVTEAASGQRWQFAELRDLAEATPASSGTIREARGSGIGFILETLTTWRDGAILCPCEAQDKAPSGLTPPPEACHLKRTSGSTGSPRGIWFTAPQLAADASQIVSTMGLRPDWPNLSVLSLAHSYGFSNLVLPLLLHGVPLVIVKDALPGSVEHALTLFEHVTFPAVPAMWRAWLGSNILNERIRLAISAGAPLTLQLEKTAYERTGLKIHNFYGSSECGGIAYDRSETPREDESFVGTPLDGVSLGLVQDCLRVSSPAVGLAYAEDPDDPILSKGHFLTSDQAVLGKATSVFLRGRHGDTINVAGRKVSPELVETALLSLPGVEHAVAFGIPSKDPIRVEDIVAAVRLTPDTSFEEIQRHLTLSSWQRPRHWWVCENLAPDGRGKISRAQWRDLYLKNHHS